MLKSVLKIKKCNESATIPTCASDGSAGYDLYSIEKTKLMPGETAMIHTGISIAVESGYFGAIYPRSGLSAKEGLRLANCVGVIDSDYRGEVIVALYNDSKLIRTVEVGERVAQLIVSPYSKPDIEVVDDLDDTERGSGGFGSTGKQ